MRLKKESRWPVLVILAVLVLAGIISGFGVVFKGKPHTVHAANDSATFTAK